MARPDHEQRWRNAVDAARARRERAVERVEELRRRLVELRAGRAPNPDRGQRVRAAREFAEQGCRDAADRAASARLSAAAARDLAVDLNQVVDDFQWAASYERQFERRWAVAHAERQRRSDLEGDVRRRSRWPGAQ